MIYRRIHNGCRNKMNARRRVFVLLEVKTVAAVDVARTAVSHALRGHTSDVCAVFSIFRDYFQELPRKAI